MKHQPRKPYLTPTEVAEMLMVSPVTVRQWAQKKLLPAESTPGGHRRFLRHQVESFARDRGLALQPARDGSLRILVVDDDKLVATSLVALLEEVSAPIEVEAAFNGFDAGRKVLIFDPHIVLLDLVMEGLDGFEVCARLKGEPATRAVRVIAMTGYATPENERRILAVGAEVCLRKPINPSKLLAAIGLEEDRAPRALGDSPA